jgi:putative ABC transport system substrate-binding protein
MKGRREFITLLGGATAWPVAVGAQQPPIPVVGYLSSATQTGFANFVAAFRQGLSEAGYIEPRNVKIEFRWAEGHNDQLPRLAADLVARAVSVIAATGGFRPAVAAKAATTTIPIVFTGGGDPVKFGLVASLARPGGNATGVVNFSPVLTGKRLELLTQMLPTNGTIAVLANPNAPNADFQVKEVQEAASAVAQPIQLVNASTEHDFDTAFTEITQRGLRALFVIADPFFTSRRSRLVELAAQHRIPACYAFRDFPLAGGLMSYGANLPDVHRQAGVYTGRILNGIKPVDLPVLQPTKFELVINLQTARALGLPVPDKLLALADEVIE